jgi:DNA repair protein RecO (recombination protein O)
MAKKGNRFFDTMPPERFDGIVLNLKKGMGPQSLLTVFTKQRGWMRVFLTRDKKGGQGFGSLLPFRRISFDAWQKSGNFSLSEYDCLGNEPIQSFSYESYVYMQIFVEMVLLLVPEGQADQAVYSLLENYCWALAAKDTRILTILAGWQLVSAAGFRPDAQQVQVYVDGLDEQGNKRYSFCDEPPELGCPMDLAAPVRELWESLLDYDWQDVPLAVSRNAIAVLEVLLYSYVHQCAERPMKSIAALEDIL